MTCPRCSGPVIWEKVRVGITQKFIDEGTCLFCGKYFYNKDKLNEQELESTKLG